METTNIKVPENIRYLTEWEEFSSLYKGQHLIIDKGICGCGATESYIRSNEPLIMVMPRKHLLYNKYSQHVGENIFLYRFLDKAQYFNDKTPSKAELEQFDSLFIDYIRNGGTKILATFDSLDKLSRLLRQEGVDINRFRVIVDEFQQIIGDAPFKANVEHQFYSALKKFDSVVYLSATPFLQKYLEMTEQFRDLTMVKLEWPEDAVKKADVNVIRLTKPITDKCCEIIQNYKKGNVPYVIDGEKRIESKEAVFFLNDVRSIINVIKKSGLAPSEVNILCAPRRENYDRIATLNKGKSESDSRFDRGDIPRKGEQHKMFTFCTSTVYIGADFYSESAYSYIFANPNVESLTVDVGTDLQQIVGRQRREDNPFRMKADLYYFLKKPFISEEEMAKEIERKRRETQKHIDNFNSAVHKDSQLKSLEALINKGHSDQYCCISEDVHGNKTVVENSLIAIAEKRAWDIANTVYSGDLSLIKVLKDSVNILRGVDSTDPDVRKLFDMWSKDSQFKRRAMMYCELCEQQPGLLVKCTFIPAYFHQYYEALGRKGFEDLKWRQDYIKEALAPTPADQMPHRKVAAELVSRFQEGREYPKEDIKKSLIEIYLKLDIKGKPSAIDIQRYFTVKESSIRVGKKKTATIKILSHWQKEITLFSSITAVLKPMHRSDVDSVLREIQEGSAYNLKSRTENLRSETNPEKYAHLKRNLPVATWNGVFVHRDSSGCSAYSSFTALDFDHVEDLDTMKIWLQGFPCVYAYFTTPSGKGIKAIVLHDNRSKENHEDLYAQLLKHFECDTQDTSTSDLGRGNYLCYDPMVWINPSPSAFHYEPSEVIPKKEKKTYTVVKGSSSQEVLQADDSLVSQFLAKLSQQIISDESIVNMLRKIWNQSTIGRGRNNTALSYAGILCKAGVEATTSKAFIKELIPDLPHIEIDRAVEFAYAHNVFGSNRMSYLKRKPK